MIFSFVELRREWFPRSDFLIRCGFLVHMIFSFVEGRDMIFSFVELRREWFPRRYDFLIR